MDIRGTLLSCSFVALIWGATNVFIKRTSSDITKIKGKTWLEQLKFEVQYLIFNWKVVLPFLVNQIGSVAFYFILLFSEISFVVPVTNSLTFLFTGLVSTFVGESVPSSKSIIGSLLIVLGITMCVMDKMQLE